MALRWDTTDLDGNREAAKALLDEAGYVDADGDGMREMPDGSKIEWKAECPMGWSDWNASLEILCESAKAIGLNIVTYFPEASVYTNDQQYGTFDILMASPQPGGSVANPWNWVYQILVTALPKERVHAPQLRPLIPIPRSTLWRTKRLPPPTWTP